MISCEFFQKNVYFSASNLNRTKSVWQNIMYNHNLHSRPPRARTSLSSIVMSMSSFSMITCVDNELSFTKKALHWHIFRYHNLFFNDFDGTDGLCLDSFSQENLPKINAFKFLGFVHLSKCSSSKGCLQFEIFKG